MPSFFALTAGSLLVVVLALALAREIRLRRALQRLLGKLLNLWRNRDDEPKGMDRGGVTRRGSRDGM